MISQSQNRVKAIKSKFENLNSESDPLIVRKKSVISQLCKQTSVFEREGNNECFDNLDKENDSSETRRDVVLSGRKEKSGSESDASSEWSPEPNNSYLYQHNDLKRSLSESRRSLSRQTSDPGKKLHRSHAFRCDKSQKISPKRHGSCNGRSETSDFSLKMGERKLSKDRLKKLGNLLEDQMRKENFVPSSSLKVHDNEVKLDSVPDSDVPPHILDQYAKVLKPKRRDADKQDAMTDSGVSSETENLEDEKVSKIKKLRSQFEINSIPDVVKKTNLHVMNDLCASSDTIKLERKNPHMILTDTLKKALKQPLPIGPAPKKPPRTFTATIEESPPKKDTKQMLEKLERVLHEREASTALLVKKSDNHIYDIAETNLSLKKPKEIHYLCTEILDIAHKSSFPNTNPLANCFNSLNCAIIPNNSMTSLPYTCLSTSSNSNRNSLKQSCSCSAESLEVDSRRRLSTFFEDKPVGKCQKCQINEEKENAFKCHLNCKCKETNSEFFVEKEHIYDIPFTGSASDDEKIDTSKTQYGTLNKIKATSRSMEDLSLLPRVTEQKLYDIPCDVSRPVTPDVATESSNFAKLRRNFETGFQTNEGSRTLEKPNNSVGNIKKLSEDLDRESAVDGRPRSLEKPPKVVEISRKFSEGALQVGSRSFEEPSKQKATFVSKVKAAKSTDDLSVDRTKRTDGKYSTAIKRYKKFDKGDVRIGFCLPKNDVQLDVDRENLNRLMTEIYDAVSSACAMEHKPDSFPTDHSDANSDDSVKLSRSLTEKRKSYVRRVSSRAAYLSPRAPYCTFRSWKVFRSHTNLTREHSMDYTDHTDTDHSSLQDDSTDSADTDKLSIVEKAGCVELPLPLEPRERGLFNVCLLVGLNHMTRHAYVKSVFPSQVVVPPHIENLIFPETLSPEPAGAELPRHVQNYSLVLTDERGERAYGYCRRVLPEGASTCLPLCYCLIGKYRAPGFYYNVLKEIESHHGSSEVEINSILQQLFDSDFPAPGQEITVRYPAGPAAGRDNRSKSMPDGRHHRPDTTDTPHRDTVSHFYDLENNNDPRKYHINMEGIRVWSMRQPLEPRAAESCVSVLLDQLGAGLLVKVFGSLLLERKVLVVGDQLSTVSSCMEGLQSVLYPFVWQQPLISAVPRELQHDVVQAPLPVLAGMLSPELQPLELDEGMLIDLSSPGKVLRLSGDESSILPAHCYKALKVALQMESNKNKDKVEDSKTRNVMISEAFLRFFVDILDDVAGFLSYGTLQDGDLGRGDVVFDKAAYLKSVPSKQNAYFLEWFTETSMFNHFIQNLAALYHNRHADTRLADSRHADSRLADNRHADKLPLIDTPMLNFYDLFEERLRFKNTKSITTDAKNNYKNAVNKKMKLLKSKLRELVA